MTRLFANDIGHEPRLEPPDQEPIPVCPICGAETDLFYVDKLNGIVGCPECVLEMDAYVFAERE